MTASTAEKTECVRIRVAACPAGFARPPAAGEAFAWVVDLVRPPVAPAELFARLTHDERARALRYKIAKAREQFVTCRGLLRGLLGDYLGLEPAAVPLSYLPSGKPVLRGESLHFNVTHTDGVAVLAVARGRVGVDVERPRDVADAEGLVGRYFSAAEAEAFRALPVRDRGAAFFRGWTCKEAVIKAAGATVGCLADFDVELHPRRPPRVNAVRDAQLAGAGWSLAEWRTPDGAAVALALEGAAALILEGDSAQAAGLGCVSAGLRPATSKAPKGRAPSAQASGLGLFRRASLMGWAAPLRAARRCRRCSGTARWPG